MTAFSVSPLPYWTAGQLDLAGTSRHPIFIFDATTRCFSRDSLEARAFSPTGNTVYDVSCPCPRAQAGVYNRMPFMSAKSDSSGCPGASWKGLLRLCACEKKRPNTCQCHSRDERWRDLHGIKNLGISIISMKSPCIMPILG